MKKILKLLMDGLHKFSTAIAYVGAAMIAVLMLLTVTDVVMRRVMNASIIGCYEISQLMLLTIAFFSFAYGQMKKAHIHVTMFIQLLPEKACMLFFAITAAISVVICGFMTVAAFVMAKEAFHSETATWVLYIPHWPFYIIEGVSMFLLTIVMIEDVIAAFKAIKDPVLAAEIKKTWL